MSHSDLVVGDALPATLAALDLPSTCGGLAARSAVAQLVVSFVAKKVAEGQRVVSFPGAFGERKLDSGSLAGSFLGVLTLFGHGLEGGFFLGAVPPKSGLAHCRARRLGGSVAAFVLRFSCPSLQGSYEADFFKPFVPCQASIFTPPVPRGGHSPFRAPRGFHGPRTAPTGRSSPFRSVGRSRPWVGRS